MSSLNRLNGLNRIEQLARTGPFKPFNRCAWFKSFKIEMAAI